MESIKSNSSYNEKRKYRDLFRLVFALLIIIRYFSHIVCFFLSKRRNLIEEDVKANKILVFLKLNTFFTFLFLIHTNRYFRTIFYHRVNPICSLFLNLIAPSDRYFSISKTTSIDGGFVVAHPYSTIINAQRVGRHFLCRNCTTIGEKKTMDERPVIGNNVTLGASVTIIGNVVIGDNVVIGAGSVVVKDIPSNCIVAGNPAKPIKNNVQ